jgi:hypothetical protein
MKGRVGAKKNPLSWRAGESISGGDMEETGVTIHTDMVRCNIFLMAIRVDHKNE